MYELVVVMERRRSRSKCFLKDIDIRKLYCKETNMHMDVRVNY